MYYILLWKKKKIEISFQNGPERETTSLTLKYDINPKKCSTFFSTMSDVDTLWNPFLTVHFNNCLNIFRFLEHQSAYMEKVWIFFHIATFVSKLKYILKLVDIFWYSVRNCIMYHNVLWFIRFLFLNSLFS